MQEGNLHSSLTFFSYSHPVIVPAGAADLKPGISCAAAIDRVDQSQRKQSPRGLDTVFHAAASSQRGRNGVQHEAARNLILIAAAGCDLNLLGKGCAVVQISATHPGQSG
jgi:hypothetical protein